MDAMAGILRDSPKPFVGDKAAIARVRCVLMQADRYLLAQHNSRRENLGQWGLPGGRLKGAEKPKAVPASRAHRGARLPRTPSRAARRLAASQRATTRLRLRDREAHRHLRRRGASRHRLVQLRRGRGACGRAQIADGLRARRHQRVSALARRPSLTATVHRRRLPPLMESHVIKYLPSAERAVRMLSIRSSQSPLASFGRTALTWLAPTSICTGGFLS